jgi:adenosylhomocysteine nucleosidase
VSLTIRQPRPSAGQDLSIDDPCVVFAMRRESRPFCRDFRPHLTFRGAPRWAKFCGPAWLRVLAVESGVGSARTEQAAAWLLSGPKVGNLLYRPKMVLAAGFCGALEGSLRTGDLVLATEVIDAASGARWPTTWPGQLPPGPWQPPLHRGPLVTVPRLAATPEQKQSLAATWGALAVDMESAALARLCQQAAVPFGCLRVVVDEANAPLSPRLVTLFSSARVSPFRLAAALISNPSLVKALRHLAKSSAHAADQLAKALGEVLTLSLPEKSDPQSNGPLPSK